jgi:hypothetical protein
MKVPVRTASGILFFAVIIFSAVAFSAALATGDITGTYKITSASNPSGEGKYEGTVTIERVDKSYTLRWNTSGHPQPVGVGILMDNILGVGYGEANNGVIIYKVTGGKLEGKWTTPRMNGKVGNETLEGPAGLNGDYKITSSRSPDTGHAYTGTVSIIPEGKRYLVEWKLAHESYKGVGILDGEHLVVGWGTAESGVVSYRIRKDALSGQWAIPGSPDLGTENLAKR